MKNFVTIILLISISSILNANVCQKKYEDSPKYKKANAEVESLLIKFSNNKAIASKADALLSKLISAKSPVLVNWLKKRNLSVKDDIKVIKTWRKYFSQNFILPKYPHKESDVNFAIEKLMSDVKSSFSSSKFEKEMESHFKVSKNQALEFIKESKLSDDAKKQIQNRISAIKLYWMKDFKTSKFVKYPIEYVSWGIAYDPVANEINMGMHSLAYPNKETYLAVFAHEIGHSIDSCRWGAFLKGKWPFENVGSCLRSSESVGAKKRDDSKMQSMLAQRRLSKDLITALKLHPTCNKRVYPPVGTQSDQLPESFADWFSAEVVARIPGLDKKALRQDLCKEADLMDGSSYVSNKDRLQGIYFSHPKLKSSGVKAMKYCEL